MTTSELRVQKVLECLARVRLSDFLMGELSEELKDLQCPYPTQVPSLLKKLGIIFKNEEGCYNLIASEQFPVDKLQIGMDEIAQKLAGYQKKSSEGLVEITKAIPQDVATDEENAAINFLKSRGFKISKEVVTKTLIDF